MESLEAQDLAGLVERLDHVAFAVHDVADQLPLLELLGATFRAGGDFEEGGFRWAQFRIPANAKIELIQPLDPGDEAHFVNRFLAARGPGVHHLTFKVSDIEAAITKARELGFEVVGVNIGRPGWREAFVHPKSAHGVLVQLAQWEDAPDPDMTLDDLLGS